MELRASNRLERLFILMLFLNADNVNLEMVLLSIPCHVSFARYVSVSYMVLIARRKSYTRNWRWKQSRFNLQSLERVACLLARMSLLLSFKPMNVKWSEEIIS